MDNERIKSMAGEAVRLNLAYYVALIDATRNYLGALKGIVESGAAPQQEREAPARPAAPAIPPLLMSAVAGQVAEAAFAVSNGTGQEVTADPLLSDALTAAGVTAEPSGRLMAPGEDATFRLSAQVDANQNSDIHGTVSIPGLGDREIPVVLRRVPDAPDGAKA
jgi:hypothetical protein